MDYEDGISAAPADPDVDDAEKDAVASLITKFTGEGMLS